MMLVTGAGGHIGNVLVKYLNQQGYRDLRLFLQPDEETVHIEAYAKEIAKGDIRDAQAVSNAVRGCETVFHLAGLIDTTGSRAQLLRDINVGGVQNVVNACMAHHVRRLVYVSSIDVFSPSDGQQIDETAVPDIGRCPNDYSRTKLKGTMEVLAACEKGLNAVVVYPTAVIGPCDYRDSMSGLLFHRYINARGIQPCFDGRFDFVDVRDVADGLYRAWRYGEAGEGYILSGEVCSVGDMIRMIGRCCGKKLKTFHMPTALVRAFAGIMPAYYAVTRKMPAITRDAVDVMVSGVSISNEKAKRRLGFAPRPLEETIRDAVRWYREAETQKKRRVQG